MTAIVSYHDSQKLIARQPDALVSIFPLDAEAFAGGEAAGLKPVLLDSVQVEAFLTVYPLLAYNFSPELRESNLTNHFPISHS